MPLAFLREGGWWPKQARGLRWNGMRAGASLWTCFHIEYGMVSGPGADEEEELDKACETSSGEKGRKSGESTIVARGGGRGSLDEGKKCCRRASLSSSGVEAPGREGKRLGREPMAIFLMVHMERGSARLRILA